jgi:2,3-dihydroxybenzoate decarboxylase
MIKKIALEEHFQLPAYNPEPDSILGKITEGSYLAELGRRLGDPAIRLAEMDQAGVELAVLSLTTPGIQGEPDPREAVRRARQMNDELFEKFVRPHPSRFAGFAAIPLQDPHAASAELTRAVQELGYKGAMINGYSQIRDAQTVEYLDEERLLPFWETVARLEVPVYLHPRMPMLGQRRIYDGYPVLLGSAWGFGVETATHALRLVMSGLFDRFPGIQLVLGHFGETIPFAAARIDQRLQFHTREHRGKQQLRVSDYLKRNFYFTTSGFCHNPALINTLGEVGADRVMFSADYPFESLPGAAQWFEKAPLSEADRTRIAYENARRLLKLR